MKRNKNYKQLTLLTLLGGFIAPAVCAETPATAADIDAIKANWKCKYCPDLSEESWQTTLSAGVGYVTNDSYKFGEYNGMQEEGFYFAAGINARYRDDEANYWDIQGENLGMDNGRLQIEGGKQGTYKLNFGVDEITRYQIDTARTPYNGDSVQTLPGGWVPATTTAGFTTLANDLHDIQFSTERRNITLGAELVATARWSYEAWFKRQTKQGNLPTSFTFGFGSAANLSMPIDYTTDDVELKANYHGNNFSSTISFINSTFKNAFDSFRWQNAYDQPATATEGQAGVAPDNSKQQITLSGIYSGFEDWQLTGLLSYAQMTQDEAFLPYTVNGTLVTAALPTNSLDGRVNVYNMNLGAHWQSTEDMRWHFNFEQHEHDNVTDRYTYSYVTTDSTVTGTPRANTPFSFLQRKIKAATDINISDSLKLDAGLQRTLLERTYQSVESQDENTLWLKLIHHIDKDLQYNIKAEYSDRSIDNYNVLNELTPPANPNMRKYNMADRSGYRLGFNISTALGEGWLLNFTTDFANYDYGQSNVGLTGSDELTIGLDTQYVVDEDLSFNAFVTNTNISSDQAGSQAFSTADWFASNDDNVTSGGLGFNYQVIEDKLKVGMDYVHAEATSDITISTGAPLPKLKSSRDTILVHGDYIVDDNLTIRATYQYEDYKENNWSVDNVAPDTISNVLTLGNRAPDYNIGAFWLSMHYTF